MRNCARLAETKLAQNSLDYLELISLGYLKATLHTCF